MKTNIYYSPQRFALKEDSVKKSSDAVDVDNLAFNTIKKLNISHGQLLVFLSVVIVMIGGLYLLNFNKNMTKGYELQKLHIERDKLNKERDRLNMNIAKAGSFNEILAGNRMNGMVKPANVEFVLPDGNILAAK